MKYRLTCLTPLLVGDGRRLAPIDYMVWKDQVSVLDQNRIFRLLAKGPRLEGYLNQLKRADKLDFASWGGFAQNYADRRIPFENLAYSAYWNRCVGDSLFIPTFASGVAGPYLPGAAIKGALRTGMVSAGLRDHELKDLADRMKGDRPVRRPAEALEDHSVGNAGSSRMRLLAIGDSAPVDFQRFKIYLLRTSTLNPRGGGYGLAWKQSPRGAVEANRVDDSTPGFAEMAPPGSVFEGAWSERDYFQQPEVRRAVRWPETFGRAQIFEAANQYAERLLALHQQYATWTGLGKLTEHLAAVESHLATARQSGACILPLGWGAGLLGKSAWLDTLNPEYREILEHHTLYNRALASKLPFPKTRRIVFENNQPSNLPGWSLLEVG